MLVLACQLWASSRTVVLILVFSTLSRCAFLAVRCIRFSFRSLATIRFAFQELNPWKKDKGIVGLTSKFAIAQTTAIIAGFISYPFDTVRRRLQMQAEKARTSLDTCLTPARNLCIGYGLLHFPCPVMPVFLRAASPNAQPKEQWLYNGTLDCAVKIIKDEGIGAMFKGFAANVLRTLGGALVLVGYDEIKRIIG